MSPNPEINRQPEVAPPAPQFHGSQAPDLGASASVSAGRPPVAAVDPKGVEVFAAPPSRPGLSPLPEGAQLRIAHPKVDVQVAELVDGSEALFIDGQQIPLDPERNPSPYDVMGVLRNCTTQNELLDHVDAYRSLGMANQAAASATATRVAEIDTQGLRASLRPATAPIEGQWCVTWETNVMMAPAFNYYPTQELAAHAYLELLERHGIYPTVDLGGPGMAVEIRKNDAFSRDLYFDDKLGKELPYGFYARVIGDDYARWKGPYESHAEAKFTGPGSRLEPHVPPFWVNPHAQELDLMLKTAPRGAKAEMASHEAINAGGKAVTSGEKPDHDDAKSLHRLASELHRGFARNYNPETAEHSNKIADLHDRAAAWHEERGSVFAKPEDFLTPESTDAFYMKKYGQTHPPERAETDRAIAGAPAEPTQEG